MTILSHNNEFVIINDVPIRKRDVVIRYADIDRIEFSNVNTEERLLYSERYFDISIDGIFYDKKDELAIALADLLVFNQGDNAQATETVKGIAEIATQTETNTGTDDLRIVTPLKLSNWWANIKTLTQTIEGIWTWTNGAIFSPLTNPTYVKGLVFYDNNSETLAYYDDISGTTNNINQEQSVRARNNTGSTILNGQVVYITGALGQNPTIALARADSLNTSQIIGIATHNIANNTIGKITTFGLINELDTSSFADGAMLYLSNVTAGLLTATTPVSPNYNVYVCTVLHSHPTLGKLFIHPSSPISLNTALTDLDNVSPSVKAVKTALDGKQPLLTNPVTGTGTTNRLPKLTASSVIGDSILQEVSTTAKGIAIQSITPTNTSFGYNSLASASLSGVANTGFGHNILTALTTGSNNSAFGYDVLKAITNGNNNTGFGFNCLSALSTGSENNSFGYLCFNNLTSGSANVTFGVGAARFIADGVTALTTCNQSIFLGNLTKALANNSLNEIVIGHNAIGNGNNSATLGASTITKTILRGNVLIGTTTDNGVDKLQVNGNIKSFGTIVLGSFTTGTEPAYVQGAMYFNTTLNKMRVGGATTWETVTSL